MQTASCIPFHMSSFAKTKIYYVADWLFWVVKLIYIYQWAVVPILLFVRITLVIYSDGTRIDYLWPDDCNWPG